MNRLFIHQALFRILAAPVLGVMVYLLILLINNDFSELENIFSGVPKYMFALALAFISLEAMRFTLSVSEKWLSKQSIRRRITGAAIGYIKCIINAGNYACHLGLLYIGLVGFADQH
jgi:hypothetical protein